MEPDAKPDSARSRPLDDVLSRTLPELRAFVRRRLGRKLATRESISDVVQSACRSLIEDGVPNGVSEEGVRRRLFRNAKHKIVDHARREFAQRRDGDVKPLLEDSADESKESLPEHPAEQSDDVARVLEAMNGIDAEDREIIVLSTLLELPHAEIASQLDISVGAARTRLCRALARLALALETPKAR